MKNIFNLFILIATISMILYIGKEYKFYHDNNQKIRAYNPQTKELSIINPTPERLIK